MIIPRGLPKVRSIEFYQVIPLYREEVQYKIKHSAGALLGICLDERLKVIDPHWLNLVINREKINHDLAEMDTAETHLKKFKISICQWMS